MEAATSTRVAKKKTGNSMSHFHEPDRQTHAGASREIDQDPQSQEQLGEAVKLFTGISQRH